MTRILINGVKLIIVLSISVATLGATYYISYLAFTTPQGQIVSAIFGAFGCLVYRGKQKKA
jgi:hypothetical protein